MRLFRIIITGIFDYVTTKVNTKVHRFLIGPVVVHDDGEFSFCGTFFSFWQVINQNFFQGLNIFFQLFTNVSFKRSVKSRVFK